MNLWNKLLDLAPRPLDWVGSIKLKLAILLLGSGAAGASVLWFGLGMLPPKTTATAAAVALLTSQVLAHGVTSPLRDLTSATRQMARGDYSARVRSTSRDEVGQLAAAFNQMAADLGDADRSRRELIADVSHELRTPVTALQAALENLADGVVEPTPEVLRAAHSQTERLGRLVGDLMDLSRLEAGVQRLQIVRFDVAPFLEQSLAEAALLRRIPVRMDAEDGLVARADVDRLRQVMANLLSNALRHSPADAEVTASARSRGREVVIEVADSGPGIPAEQHGRVFERFARVESGRRGDGGTGLGLAICRHIVELHGGSIGVAADRPGCVIQVRLPR